MRWIGLLLMLTIMTGLSGGAFFASSAGWGLPGMLDKPVSIREESIRRRSGSGASFLYFGGHRSHFGGGFQGGK